MKTIAIVLLAASCVACTEQHQIRRFQRVGGTSKTRFSCTEVITSSCIFGVGPCFNEKQTVCLNVDEYNIQPETPETI